MSKSDALLGIALGRATAGEIVTIFSAKNEMSRFLQKRCVGLLADHSINIEYRQLDGEIQFRGAGTIKFGTLSYPEKKRGYPPLNVFEIGVDR